MSAFSGPATRAGSESQRGYLGNQRCSKSRQKWIEFSPVLYRTCHLNPNPAICVPEALQSLMKTLTLLSASNTCLPEGGKCQRDQVGDDCQASQLWKLCHVIVQAKPQTTQAYKSVSGCVPGPQLTLNPASSCWSWTGVPENETRKVAWCMQRQGRGDSCSLTMLQGSKGTQIQQDLPLNAYEQQPTPASFSL